MCTVSAGLFTYGDVVGSGTCKIHIDHLNSQLDLDIQHLGHLQATSASDVQ